MKEVNGGATWVSAVERSTQGSKCKGPEGEHGRLGGALAMARHWTGCMTHTVSFYPVTPRGYSPVTIPVLLVGHVEAQGESVHSQQVEESGFGLGAETAQPLCCHLRPRLATGHG